MTTPANERSVPRSDKHARWWERRRAGVRTDQEAPRELQLGTAILEMEWTGGNSRF
jgi:hypothetical protein